MCGKGCGFASGLCLHRTHQPQVTSKLHTPIYTTLWYFLNSGLWVWQGCYASSIDSVVDSCPWEITISINSVVDSCPWEVTISINYVLDSLSMGEFCQWAEFCVGADQLSDSQNGHWSQPYIAIIKAVRQQLMTSLCGTNLTWSIP